MNRNKITLILSLFTILNTSVSAISIDQYICIMQNSSPQQRVKMMNKLKINLVKMNNSDRQATIAKLRKKNSSTKPITIGTDKTMRFKNRHQLPNSIISKEIGQIINNQTLTQDTSLVPVTPNRITTPNQTTTSNSNDMQTIVEKF